MTKANEVTIVEEPTKTAVPLTQKTVDAILATDSKVGRKALATKLGIPAAQVWSVRVVAGLTRVDAKSQAYCAARLARAGVTVAKPKPVRKPRAKKAPVAA